MKILSVADFESKYITDFFDPAAFSGVEMIIACGDLRASYLEYLVTMIPAPLFYVHGNHDKSYLRSPPLGCDCIDGKLMTYHGVRMLGLGGCKSFNTAAYEYNELQMWRRVKKMEGRIRKSGGLDILVTHAPALGVGDQPGTLHEGFESFRYIVESYQPSLHLFGHVHLSGSPVNKTAVWNMGNTTSINTTGYKLIEI